MDGAKDHSRRTPGIPYDGAASLRADRKRALMPNIRKFFASVSFRTAAFLAFAGALLAGAPSARAAVLPPGFELQPVIVNIFEPGRPVAFAQLPDGRFLILERNLANIRLHPVGGAVAPVIHTVANVGIADERGLLGIAIDPAWPTRPYVYLQYTHVDLTVRILRMTAIGDLNVSSSTTLSLVSPYQVISDMPDTQSIHNGGTLRFGTDGMLYSSLGDDSDGCNAQNLAILAGKILRLDVSGLPAGAGGPPAKSAITPAGNPFSGPGANEKLVWVWGLRNPFRFTIDPATNALFIGDVGLSTYEEIDLVPFPGGGGQNLGWPHREGFFDPGLGLSCGASNSFTDPIYSFPHVGADAVVGGPCYRVGGGAHAFGAAYEGAVLVSEFYDGWLRWIVDTGSGWDAATLAPGQPNATDWVTDLDYIADSQVGSDGALYLLQLIPYTGSPSGLYRIVPAAASSAETLPSNASLVRLAPNPASLATGTRITWQEGRGETRSIGIVDAAGRRVRTMTVRSGVRGEEGVLWNLRDDAGAPVSSGMYVVSIRDEGGTAVEGKIFVVR